MRHSHLHFISLVTGCGVGLLIPSISEGETQTFRFQLPPFETADGYVFQTSAVNSVPQFSTQNNFLVVKKVEVNLQYQNSQKFDVTNIGDVADFGRIHVNQGVDASGPNGTIWGAPYSSTSGGPFLTPGQSLTMTAVGGVNKTKDLGGLSAQVWIGQGNVEIASNIVVTHSVVDPASFTASPAGGFTTEPILMVTYDYKCVSDTNDDGQVNVSDLLAVVQSWGYVGTCSVQGHWSPCPTDVAPANGALWGDGYVNVEDLLQVLQHWGICPTP